MVAVVGQSGAASDDLSSAAPSAGADGRHDPHQWVLLDQLTLDSLRQQVGFLPQKRLHFNQTLRENILLAAPEGSVFADQLARSLSWPSLQELLDQRGRGWLTRLAGYHGQPLSGGETAATGPGRLILRDPQMIICDEYTAKRGRAHGAADPRGDPHPLRRRTRIVITHELAHAAAPPHHCDLTTVK